ncbi:MAG: cation diffusion facilitator family transporter [Eubacteriales bacterium]|nr:cation diffusion facilitator family transporter [Eubacteriales bacterium]MDD4323822.1 cation diffusion facilitator family transporter [Eubacteriales bacterium]MDD4540793.1 cation diffusion facilitator family transporter [Eubacteriales bacterium]
MDLQELKITAQDGNEAEERKSQGIKAAVLGIILNLLLAISKIIAGYLSGSVAISADGWNNVSDAFSSIVTMLSFAYSSKPADKEHPFGHARAEYIASSIIALGMLIVGLSLGRQSIERIISPQDLDFGIMSYLSLGISIAVKGFLYFYYNARAKRLSSPAMRASAKDSLADVISTLAVLLSTILFAVGGINIDGLTGLMVSVFILWSAIGIMRNMVNRLMGSPPSNELKQLIIDEIMETDPGILGVHDLLLHDYGPGNMHASAHVEIDSKMTFVAAHLLLDRIESKFYEDYGLEIVLHGDPTALKDPLNGKLVEMLQETAHKIDPAVDVHDLQQFETADEHILAFDVSLPDNVMLSDEEIRYQFRTAFQKNYPELTLIIAIERAYQTSSKEQISDKIDKIIDEA